MSTVQEVEAALGRAGQQPRFFAGPDAGPDDSARMEANFAAISAEIDAPSPGLLARILKRFGADDRIVPLVTATPALRRSWLAAVAVALLFALNAASGSAAEGTDRIVIFLTIAPLVPLLGVALAFGPAVDPTHEVAVAAPMDGFRLFLVRSVTVFAASTGMLLIGSLLVPAGGVARVGWLLPALATTVVAMAAPTRVDARAAAGAVAATWVVLVVVVSQITDPGAMFGPITQLASVAVAAGAMGAFLRRRRQLDELSIRGGR